MILERVELESWGCLRWPLTLDLHPRVNLIHAPNETGKSTLVQAVRYALLDPVTSNVEALRPWGSTVSPRASVQFRTAGSRWRVEKRFMRPRGEARLYRERGGRWELAADDPDEVYVQTVRLVTGADIERPRRGRESAEAQRARRGVLYVLWREQGQAPLDGLELPGSGEQHLAQAVGTGVLTARDRRLMEAAGQRAEELRTARRRDETGALLKARQRLEQAEREVEARRAEVARVREWEERAEAAAALLEETRARLQEALGALAAAKADQDRAREAVGDLAAVEQAAARAEAEWAVWQKKLEDLQTARRELDVARERRGRASAALEARRQQVAVLRGQLEEAERERDRRQEAAGAADLAAARARAVRDRARLQQQRTELARRLSRAGPLERTLAEKEQEQHAVSVPEAAELRRLEELGRQLAVEKTRLEGARVRLRFTAALPLKATAALDGVRTEMDLAPEAAIEWEVLEHARIDLTGLGRLEVERSLEQSWEEQRRKVQGLETALGEALAHWGAASLAELRERRERVEAYAQDAARARAELDGLLPDGREAALHELAQVEARLLALAAAYPVPDGEAPGGAGAAEAAAAAAEAAAAGARKQLEEARQQASVSRQQLKDAEADLPALEEGLREAERAVGRLTGRIETLEDDQLDEGARRVRLQELTAARDAAAGELGRRREALPGLQVAEEALNAARREVERLQEQQAQEERALQDARVRALMAAEGGSHTGLIRSGEEREEAAAAYEALKLEADARELLYRLLVEERDRERAALFQPVAERVSRLWLRISGGRYQAVRFEDQLRPAAVAPRDYPEVAPSPDVLSGGAQEQLGTVLRLVLAEVLAGDGSGEGQTVILDEPLPHSDPLRRRRVVELLSNPAPGLQIVLLANDPRDYAALRYDACYDLAALLEAAGRAQGAS